MNFAGVKCNNQSEESSDRFGHFIVLRYGFLYGDSYRVQRMILESLNPPARNVAI